MSSERLSSRGFAQPVGLCAAALFCASISFFASPGRAQQQDDQQVAEAARQEKARKAAQQKKETHVYTNEDLHQAQILIQQDRARVEARKHAPAATPEKSVPPAVDADKNSPSESLGEVARRYRREKTANEQATQHAARPLPPSSYPMDLSQPTFAAPVQPVAPVAPLISRPRQSVKTASRLAPFKRDPFSREFISPIPPNATPRLSPIQPAPVRPILSFPNDAPRTPAARNATPLPTPRLLLPSKPVSPPASLAPHPAPLAPSPDKWTGGAIRIQPGDSLWKLARVHLGKGSRWNELLASNPNISDPTRIQPGAMLVVPSTSLRPRAQPPNSLTVQSGDSLWKLAASHLGSGTAWTCIAQANPQLHDPNRLRPGQVLSLPVSCLPISDR